MFVGCCVNCFSVAVELAVLFSMYVCCFIYFATEAQLGPLLNKLIRPLKKVEGIQHEDAAEHLCVMHCCTAACIITRADSFDANDLNKVLRNIMDGLSVKVFRTYNASIHFERMLREQVG
jgi:hypothetical protein